MKSSVLALMAVAVIGFSGVAYAGQATKPAAMSDAEMDKVTAGDPGNGNYYGAFDSHPDQGNHNGYYGRNCGHQSC